MIELLGYMGILLLNLAYLPQIITTLRRRQTDQHSAVFYFMIAVGINFYLVYAIWRQDPVFILSNCVGQIQPWMMMYFSIKWKNGDGKT